MASWGRVARAGLKPAPTSTRYVVVSAPAHAVLSFAALRQAQGERVDAVLTLTLPSPIKGEGTML